MDILLVRYAEMGLKSRPVRQRFQEILKENIMEALAQTGEEALISSDQGRIYVRPTTVQSAVGPVSRVFGVASVSPALETSGDMEDIVSTAAHFSREVLSRGQRFAIRARREGSHPFTSMEVAREAGAEVLSHNLDREVSVDLSSPDVEIFIEVRENRAFVFDRYVQGPGGLPMGSQGRVVAVVRRERDLLAAWLMMKRGCRVAVFSTGQWWAPLERWAPDLRVETEGTLEGLIEDFKALGVVFGHTLEDMDRIVYDRYKVPSYHPLIGLSNEEIERRLEAV